MTMLALLLCSCGNKSASDAGNAEADRQAELTDISEDTETETEFSEPENETITETVTEIIDRIIEKTTEIITSAPATTKAQTTTTTAPTTVTTTAPTTTTTTAPTTTTTTAPTTVTTTAPTTVTTTAPVQRKTYGKINFTTTDINGNTVSLSDYSGYDVIMINMWEPWCGPCVNEMGDLERLYKNYKSKGFMILGAFSDEPDSAKTVMRRNGITYPLINKPAELNAFNTGAVPTTIFVDGNGNVLSEEPYVGARSYSAWEQIILSYMG